MRRREFITLLGGAAIIWPLAAHAQKPKKLPMIGFLGATTPTLQKEWTAAFVRRLAELDWIEGRSVTIAYRWGDARRQQISSHLEEFVRLKVDVIVTHGSAAVLAAKEATSVIPIVFPVESNPIENGIVTSLARPGGNITRLSLQRADTTAKRIELLREVVPSIRQLAILANVRSPGAMLEMGEVFSTGREIGLEIVKFEIRKAEEIASAFGAFKGRVDALYVAAEPLAFVNRAEINKLALFARLPTMYGVREYVDAGGLISYGPNFADLFRRSADYVDKILRGTKPGDIPVEQPTKFDLVINLITAKALGLDVPPMLLARADEVIE